ncbi:MAG: hypothetical protein Q8Q62_11285, partial [Mesorhizobium sp.]|nr:hypothetical protein [Mesorhizobium sp.]
ADRQSGGAARHALLPRPLELREIERFHLHAPSNDCAGKRVAISCAIARRVTNPPSGQAARRRRRVWRLLEKGVP